MKCGAREERQRVEHGHQLDASAVKSIIKERECCTHDTSRVEDTTSPAGSISSPAIEAFSSDLWTGSPASQESQPSVANHVGLPPHFTDS